MKKTSTWFKKVSINAVKKDIIKFIRVEEKNTQIASGASLIYLTKKRLITCSLTFFLNHIFNNKNVRT